MAAWAPKEKSMKRLSSSALVALVVGSSALAQSEVTLVAPGGARAALEQLIPAFEKKSGYKVKATFGSGLGTKQQVARGEPFDVPIVQPPYPEVLASGNVVKDSAKTLASVAVGVAVRQGASKPDISTVDAVKRMLVGAQSISYPDPAAAPPAGWRRRRRQLRRNAQEAGLRRTVACQAQTRPRRRRRHGDGGQR